MRQLIKARWVIPISGDLVISRGAVLVEENKIVAIGKHTDFELVEDVKIIDLSRRHLLIPGLINCHAHTAMTFLRGCIDDLSLHYWLYDFVLPLEQATIGSYMEDYIDIGTKIAVREALLTGTTSLNDHYYAPALAAKVFNELGVRAFTCSPVMNNSFSPDMDYQIDKAIDWLSHKSDLVQPTLGPHAMYTVSAKELESLAMKVPKELIETIVVHIHMHESAIERQLYEEEHHSTALADYLKGPFSTYKTVFAHCVELTPEEIAVLAKKPNLSICHCPKSNLKLGSGIAPITKLLAAGVNVCLGTDGGCSNNSLDMISEMQYAALLAKGINRDGGAITAFDVLKMATINGAKALGRNKDLGSLEPGKLADMIAVDLIGPYDVGEPIFDPLSHLMYTTHVKVDYVWVNGKIVVENGKLVTPGTIDNNKFEILNRYTLEKREALIKSGRTISDDVESTAVSTLI